MTDIVRTCRLCGEGFEPRGNSDVCHWCACELEKTEQDLKHERYIERKNTDWP